MLQCYNILSLIVVAIYNNNVSLVNYSSDVITTVIYSFTVDYNLLTITLLSPVHLPLLHLTIMAQCHAIGHA